MKTQIIKVNYQDIEIELIKRAGTIIRQGGLVAFPTETVYGLGGDALNPDSSKKIYEAKGRPSDNPLIVHIADKEDLYLITDEVTESAEKLMNAFWPGPLTLIFKKNKRVPVETTGGLDTVAVRFPSDPIAHAFIREAGGFVSAPSANTSGRPSTTKAEHVIEDLNGKIDMILDGGQTVIGLESTIVDVSEDGAVILRPGAVTTEMMQQVIGQVKVDQGIVESDSCTIPKAPGMKYRHYSPRAKLIIVEGTQEKVCEVIKSLGYEAENQGDKIGILTTSEMKNVYERGVVISLGRRNREEEITHSLYDALRRFDETDVKYIYAEAFPEEGIGAAIMNRLLKAAGNEILHV